MKFREKKLTKKSDKSLLAEDSPVSVLRWDDGTMTFQSYTNDGGLDESFNLTAPEAKRLYDFIKKLDEKGEL